MTSMNKQICILLCLLGVLCGEAWSQTKTIIRGSGNEIQGTMTLTANGTLIASTGATVNLGNATLTLNTTAVRGALTGGNGTLDISGYTLTLPADVTRLGSSIDLASEVTGTLPWSSVGSTPTTLAGYGITDAQGLDSDLTAIAALTTTSFGRGLLTEGNATTTRTTLGLGTLATQNGTISDYLTTANATASYQPLSGNLTTLASTASSTFGRARLNETEARTFRNTLGLPTIDNGQLYCAARIGNWSTTTTAPLRVITWGDSVSGGLRIGPQMQQQGIFVTGGALTGNATTVTGNFTIWLNGAYTNMPAGSTAQFTYGLSSDRSVDTVDIIYIKESGAGTIDVHASTNGGSSFGSSLATISAANATQIGAVSTVSLPTDVTRPRLRVRLNVTGGPVKVIGCVLYNSQGVGAIQMSNLLNGYGITVQQGLSTPDAIVQPIWQALAPDLVLHCFADEIVGHDYEASTRAMYLKFKSWRPATDFIFIPPPPSQGSDSIGDEGRTEITQRLARDYNESFFDGFSLFRSWAVANAAGLYSDITHLNGAGDWYRNYALWSQMTIGRMPLGQVEMFGRHNFWTNAQELSDYGKFGMTAGDFDANDFYMTKPLQVRTAQTGSGLGATGTALRIWEASFASDGESWGFYANNGIFGLRSIGLDFLNINKNAGSRRVYSDYPMTAPAFRVTSSTTAVNITADNQAVVTDSLSFIRLTSDSATATDRTFTLNNGSQGQMLVLKWVDATDAGELVDGGNCQLDSTWTPTNQDTITLIWDSADALWTELSRSAN